MYLEPDHMVFAAPTYIPNLRTHVVQRRFLSPKMCSYVLDACRKWDEPGAFIQRTELLSGLDAKIDRLYEKLALVSEDVNVWGIHLKSISRPLAVQKYLPSSEVMRNHVDFMPHKGEYDKLALVVMLTPRSEFSGGDLVLDDRKRVRLERGDLVAFPGYMMHHVSKVTSGVRTTLLCWVSGPAFV